MENPHDVKSAFDKIMRPLRWFFFWFESLIFSLILVSINFVFIVFMAGPLESFSDLIFVGPRVLISLVIMAGFHYIFVRRFFKFQMKGLRPFLLWYLLPALLSLGAYIQMVFSFYDYEMGLSFPLYIPITLFFLLFGFNTLFAWLARRHLIKKKLNPTPTHSKVTKSRAGLFNSIFSGLLLIYITAFSVVRTVIPYFSGEPYFSYIDPHPVFAPIHTIETMAGFIWPGILRISTGAGENINYFLLVFLPGLILLFIAGKAAYNLIRRKKWLSVGTSVIVYVLFLFLIDGSGYERRVEFNRPALHISEVIEQQEMGIFYPLFKYFNHDDSPVFEYYAGSDNGQLVIMNDAQRMYYLDHMSFDEGFQSATFEDLIKSVEPSDFDKRSNASSTVPDGFECSGNYPTFCENMMLNGELILEANRHINDVVFTDDRKWMLIAIFRCLRS